MAPSKEALEATRRQLYDEGLSIRDWALTHGFDVHLTYGVLSGRSRASRGESHRIAVALGLKQQPMISRAQLAPNEDVLPEHTQHERPAAAPDKETFMSP